MQWNMNNFHAGQSEARVANGFVGLKGFWFISTVDRVHRFIGFIGFIGFMEFLGFGV